MNEMDALPIAPNVIGDMQQRLVTALKRSHRLFLMRFWFMAISLPFLFIFFIVLYVGTFFASYVIFCMAIVAFLCTFLSPRLARNIKEIILLLRWSKRELREIEVSGQPSRLLAFVPPYLYRINKAIHILEKDDNKTPAGTLKRMNRVSYSWFDLLLALFSISALIAIVSVWALLEFPSNELDNVTFPFSCIASSIFFIVVVLEKMWGDGVEKLEHDYKVFKRLEPIIQSIMSVVFANIDVNVLILHFLPGERQTIVMKVLGESDFTEDLDSRDFITTLKTVKLNCVCGRFLVLKGCQLCTWKEDNANFYYFLITGQKCKCGKTTYILSAVSENIHPEVRDIFSAPFLPVADLNLK